MRSFYLFLRLGRDTKYLLVVKIFDKGHKKHTKEKITTRIFYSMLLKSSNKLRILLAKPVSVSLVWYLMLFVSLIEDFNGKEGILKAY